MTLLLLTAGTGLYEGDRADLIVHWSRSSVPKGHYSIPAILDEKAEEYCIRYLAWVHDLSEAKINSKSLRQMLKIDGEKSFWWLTLIAEKMYLKSPSIYTIFKLWALEELFVRHDCKTLHIRSNQNKIVPILSEWCKNCGYSLTVEKFNKKRPIKLKSIAPQTMRAGYFLIKYILKWWAFYKFKKPTPFASDAATIFTYFPFFDRAAASKGIYRSNYWGELHGLIEKRQYKVNWIFIHSGSDKMSYKDSKRQIRSFNEDNPNKNKYFVLEQFISISTFAKAIFLYFTMLYRYLKLDITPFFRAKKSKINFWKILKSDWQASLFGPYAIINSIYIHAFREVCEKLGKQCWGLYPTENQPWEHAMIWAWRHSLNSPIVGFQHATIRLRNMRFFEDPRAYHLTDFPPPLPDILAVNGKGAKDALKEVNFPNNILRPVEALRYLGLIEIINKPKSKNNRMLVITAYSPKLAAEQLSFLNKAFSAHNLKIQEPIMIKPHPACQVNDILSKIDPKFKYVILDCAINQAFTKASIAYCTNTTSAVVEAAYAGLKIILHVPDGEINFSPVRSWPGVTSVTTTDDLIRALDKNIETSVPENYFYLNQELEMWNKLLSELDS